MNASIEMFSPLIAMMCAVPVRTKSSRTCGGMFVRSPSMNAVIAPNNIGWDCTLTVTLPAPPATVHTYKYAVNQDDACQAQYPADPGVKAFRTDATPPAYGWNCYVPPAAAMRR